MRKSRNLIGLYLVAVITFIFIAWLPQAQGTEELNIEKPAIEGQTETNKININTASIEELTQLQGIGDEYAKGIVEYRELHGLFTKPEDIMNVKGIGQVTFEKIKDSIVVE